MSSDDRGILLPDVPTPARVFLALCVLALGYGVGLAIYRVYWHPLRHFPGPQWYTVSGLPAFYLTWTGRRVAFLERVHREYGDAVRIAPDELSVIGADAWKDTHGYRAKAGVGRTPIPKHWDKYVHSPNEAYNLFDAPDVEHARMRKLFQPAFSYSALPAHESLVEHHVDCLIRRLHESVGGSVDLVRLFNFTTFDIMSTLVFGDSLRMLEQDEYCPWVRAIFDFIKIDARMNALGQLLPPVRALAGCLFGRLIQKKKAEHFRFCEERVSHRLRAEPPQPDIWKFLLENKKQGQRLTKEEIDSNAFVLMVAGTETVATSLSGLFYLLLKHPKAMARLTKEVRSAFHGTTPKMTSKELRHLHFLLACIKETLRLYPPTPTGSARLVPSQGATVCGLPIPGGVSGPL
ncbi:mRNA 3'-end-processing protein yth1 [Alternaria alternata]|nr:mRNA 3'-end-processing protein yth1 [Alternaria alternata]